MEALNRIKKGVAETIQKADDEIRDRARREAERQVTGSRGASSSNDARSDATTARGRTASRPDGGGVAPVARVARVPPSDAANVDVELIVTTMRSELDETRRRLDDFDARLERRLAEALGTLRDVASAQIRDDVHALVREETRNAVASRPMGAPATVEKTERETFEEATRAESASIAPPAAPRSAEKRKSDAKAAAAAASEVPPGMAEALRALEARVEAAEAECARLERARAEADAKDGRKKTDEKAGVSAAGKGSEDASGRRRVAAENETPRDDDDAMVSTHEASRARLEEVAETAFSSAAAAARAEARAEETAFASAARVEKDPSETEDRRRAGADEDVAASIAFLRGETRRVAALAEGSANAEHVAFAAVESSKRATEKLDELSGTVAELAEALEAARGEPATERGGGLGPARDDADITKEAVSEFRKRVESLTTRLGDVEARTDARWTEFEAWRASNETRDAEKEAKETASLASASARSDATEASLRSVAEKLASVARGVDDRLGAMRLAVETELVAAMRAFEKRLDAIEARLEPEDGDGGGVASGRRVSLLEARLAEAMTLAESALRRVDAVHAHGERAEQVAENAELAVRRLADDVEATARESETTKALLENSARRAEAKAREVALAEARQTERAVWDTVMLLSADVASARRRSPGSVGGSGGGRALGPPLARRSLGSEPGGASRTPSPTASVPRGGGEVSGPGTPAGSTPAGGSGGKAPRFQALRRLFKSPRNEFSDDVAGPEDGR